MGGAASCASAQVADAPNDSMKRRAIAARMAKNKDIKVHSMISASFDMHGEYSKLVPLGDVTDEELMAEVARRKLDVHHNITDSLVRETYDIGEKLGSGASGEVFLCTHKPSGRHFALKIVQKDQVINDLESMVTEMEIMKRVRHRHVVSMYELYETPRCQWLVLELVNGGSLQDYILRSSTYNEDEAARLVMQMLQGVQYLHSLGIVHRDLKVENILLQSVGRSGGSVRLDVKIADFGLSAFVGIGELPGIDEEDGPKRKKYNLLSELWGTKEYFAPELINRAYGPQADLWSLGCIVFEMLCGEVAFPLRRGESDSAFYRRVTEGLVKYDSAAWSAVSLEGRSLVEGLLTVNPERRLSPGEALQHPWIANIARKLQRNAIDSEGTATTTSGGGGHNGRKMLSQLSMSQSNLRATADRRQDLRTHGDNAEIKPPNRGSFYSAGSSSFSYNTELPPSIIDSSSPSPVANAKKAGQPHQRKTIVQQHNRGNNAGDSHHIGGSAASHGPGNTYRIDENGSHQESDARRRVVSSSNPFEDTYDSGPFDS